MRSPEVRLFGQDLGEECSECSETQVWDGSPGTPVREFHLTRKARKIAARKASS